MNILLFVHVVISVLLITAILLQKTGADSLSGLSSGNNSGLGVMTPHSAANFLTRVIIFLAICFFANAIILANISSTKDGKIASKISTQDNRSSINIAQ